MSGVICAHELFRDGGGTRGRQIARHIIRAIAAGTLSATRNDPGKPWTIDAAELARAFPGAVHEPLSDRINDLPRTGDDRHERVETRDLRR